MSEQTFGEVLDDLLCRYILHSGDEENDAARLFFRCEEAYWAYLDFHRDNNKKLPQLKFQGFVDKLFERFPPLEHYRKELDAHTKRFMEYKCSVPVMGAVILSEDYKKVLLVKGWNSNSWSFPRGKINQNESDLNCAQREVEEETGFDIVKHGANEKHFIEFHTKEQKVKLFIVPGVSESTRFAPQTRKEVSAIEWHTIADLNKSSGRFWAVQPHLKRINTWITKNQVRAKIVKDKKKGKPITIAKQPIKILKRSEGPVIGIQAAA